MLRSLLAALVLAPLVLPPSPAAASSVGPLIVAAGSRCNAMVTGDLEERVRGYADKPPSADERSARFASLGGVVQDARTEEEILESSCSDDAFAPIDAHLRSIIAWATVQQADLAALHYQASCPKGEPAAIASFLAIAWYELAKATPAAGPPPAAVQAVVPLVEQRAKAVGLTMPTAANTSAYWRDQQKDAATAAVANCPKE